jgi:Uma2 family endonuclease
VLLSKHEGLITAEEFLHWPDEGRCELVRGKVIHLTASRPLHGLVVIRLGSWLFTYVDSSGRGHVLGGEVGLWVQRNPDTVRGADLMYISRERWDRRSPKGFLDIAPEFVIEILSPDDRRGEVMEKVEEYIALGIDLVWIVDPEHRCVLAYRGSLFDVERFEEGDLLVDEAILPGFSVSVADLFRE